MIQVMAALLLCSSPAHASENGGAGRLPVVAHELREAGVPDKEVRQAIDAAREVDASPEDATETLAAAEEAVREHGPIDNFGAFVQEQLKSGKRGKELAEAIKAEHEARGKGKPEDAGKPDGKGKPEDAGKPDGTGKPEDAGKPDGTGKPEDGGAQQGKGKPAGAGRAVTKPNKGKGGGQ